MTKTQIFENIITNASKDPEDFIKQAGISYRSIESFYHPIHGWRIALDTGIVYCNEKQKTITYNPFPPAFR